MKERRPSQMTRIMKAHTELNNLVLGVLNGYGVLKPREIQFSDELEKTLVECFSTIHQLLDAHKMEVCPRCLSPRLVVEDTCRRCSMPVERDT